MSAAQMPAGPARSSRAEHARAWEALARAIAARRSEIHEHPSEPAERPGELVVIGSGIETLGFTLGDDALLQDADAVFYCVADPATVVWIEEIRPDALDLYVLYDDRKPRYVTYMQMAEAMLHPVRAGKRVVCVFYGHPGIFVLATHRAILIARREGHRAVMRPGVCALDCLCADLGVDPCHPGMQTHEATDMLVRRRRPDSSLHVVLWQVGLIGEMGFRRQGYLNRNFSVLIDYLQEAYGARYPVTHYVASRYPTIPSLIETWKLSELHDPEIQARVTGLSTFYLAPRDAAPADAGMVERLGLMQPGQRLKVVTGPLREIGAYGPRERKAFEDFATFRVPDDYHWQAPTEASRFLIELRKDAALQRVYAADPGRALQDPRFARLSPAERRMLMSRDSGAIQIAAKGLQRKERSNHALLATLLRDRAACVEATRLTRAGEALEDWLAAYARARGADLVPETLAADLAHLRRHALLPWTGVYAAGAPAMTITVLGNRQGPNGLLYVGDIRIRSFVYRSGVLAWRAARGEATSGFLRFEAGPGGRRVFGQIWTANTARPESWLELAEVDPDRGRLAARAASRPIHGAYTVSAHEGVSARRVTLMRDADALWIDGVPVAFQEESGRLTWEDGPPGALRGSLQAVGHPLTGWAELHGELVTAEGAVVPVTGGPPRPPPPVLPSPTTLPEPVLVTLARIAASDAPPVRFLWQRWEKLHLTSRVVHHLCHLSRRSR